MRPLLLIALAGVVACSEEEDPRTVVPGGGGGGGGHGTAPDAAPGGDGGGGGSLEGEVCVVLDLGAPLACPVIASQRDVLVTVVGGATARSDNAGLFAVDVTAATATLELGGEPTDGLVTTRSSALFADQPIAAPVVDQGVWEEALADALEVQASGAVIVYVRDGGAALAGATVTLDGGVPEGARRYYDGAIALDIDAVATGSDGMATFLDVGGTVLATDGTREATASASATAFGITIVVVDLAP